jgi:hypothetical protein
MKTNTQMKAIYTNLKKEAQGGQINEQQMQSLIKNAQELNQSARSHHPHLQNIADHLHHSHRTPKGNKSLKALIKHHTDRFTPQAYNMAKNFLKTGVLLQTNTTSLSANTNSHHTNPPISPVNPRVSNPTITHTTVAPVPIRPAPSTILNIPTHTNINTRPVGPAINQPVVPIIIPSSRPATPAPASNTTVLPSVIPSSRPATPAFASNTTVTPTVIPSSSLRPSMPSNPSLATNVASGSMPSAPTNTTTIEAPSLSVNGAETINGSNVIVDFHGKKTWNVHWFPMKETKVGGDPVNNLYALGGPLHKLDMVNGKNARGYENTNYHKTGSEHAWWGHCNNASEIACLLPEVKRPVVMKGIDGSDVKFSKNDIQGILTKVSSHLSSNVDFRGERYNGAGGNPFDPAPELFISTIKEWSKDNLAFVMDIDNKEQVWNFPYDSAKIIESSEAPVGFNPSSISTSGNIKYYHINMEGSGYPDKKRVYDCYVVYGNDGKVLSSNWIKMASNHANPDFLWRPHPVGDLMSKNTWNYKDGTKINNPEVDMGLVYDIYMQSIA